MAEPLIEDGSSITPLRLSLVQMMEITSFMIEVPLFLELGLALDQTPHWAQQEIQNFVLFLKNFKHYCIFIAFHLNVLLVVNFLPQILNDIGIFSYIMGSLFCGRNLHPDLKNLSIILYFWIGLLDGFPNLPNHRKNIHILLILGSLNSITKTWSWNPLYHNSEILDLQALVLCWLSDLVFLCPLGRVAPTETIKDSSSQVRG